MFENYDIEVCSIFKKAENYKRKLGSKYVGTEHLFLAILDTDVSLATSLKKFNINFNTFFEDISLSESIPHKKSGYDEYTPLLKKVILLAKNENDRITPKDLLKSIFSIGEGVAIRILINEDIDVDEVYHYLNSNEEKLEVFKYGTNLNKEVNLKEKVIGRDKEINLIIETLLRKKKNNPLLVGDAGVGKSAIVEELARRIVSCKVPSILKDYTIVSLDMARVLSGTKYRGEFEEKLTNIINEIKEKQNIILFIDEVHTMAMAGAAEGAISAADILKPYLARGEIKCIAATTKKEYESSILKDKALNRRFEVILVKEPDEMQTLEILKKIKNEYTSFHKVSISEKLLEPLIHMASLYFPEKRNPDRSLELLDSVMSYVKLKDNKIKIESKENKLKKLNINKTIAIENGDYKKALKLNEEEKSLQNYLYKLKSGSYSVIKEQDIIDVLEYKNNIMIRPDKIFQITTTLKEKYEPKALKLIKDILIEKGSCSSFLLQGDCKNLPLDLANSLGYEITYLNKKEDIKKLFNKIKYYPSQIIVSNSYEDYPIESLLNKIIKEKLVEYEDEYYSFNSAIIMLIDKNNPIGFTNNYISSIPIDQIINITSKVEC